jgi:hypothetical protein
MWLNKYEQQKNLSAEQILSIKKEQKLEQVPTTKS